MQVFTTPASQEPYADNSLHKSLLAAVTSSAPVPIDMVGQTYIKGHALSSRDRYVYFVFRGPAQEVHAFLTLFVDQSGRTAYIHHVESHATAGQGKKYGRQLVTAAIQTATSAGCRKIKGSVKAAATGFFERMLFGYSEGGNPKAPYVTMERALGGNQPAAPGWL
jgi:GNAT superfamily N-acetyltransferase